MSTEDKDKLLIIEEDNTLLQKLNLILEEDKLKFHVIKPSLQRIDINLIFPIFLRKIINVLYECYKKNIFYVVISGYRTFEEQQKLYEIGRTEDTKNRKPVTNVKPGFSYHNYGLAVDVCYNNLKTFNKLSPNWNLQNFKYIADISLEYGLEPGYYFKNFKDAPHIQFNLNSDEYPNLKKITINDLYKWYNEENNLYYVWEKLNSLILNG